MPDQERPWVRVVGALILGAATVAAALVPLYCAKENRLVSTVQTSNAEIDALKQQVARDEEAVASRDTEISQLRKRGVPDCPPTALHEGTADNKSAVVPVSAPIVKTVIEHDVEFGLQTCHLSGTTLTCSLMITSKGMDRGLIIWHNFTSHSRVIDPTGREVNVSRFALGASHCETCDVQGQMPADVAIATQAGFEGVPAGTKHIQLLELFCSISEASGSRHDYVIKFQDVDI